MPPLLPIDRDERHRRITEAGSLQALLDQPDGRAVLEAEANDPTIDDSTRLIDRDQLDLLLAIRAQQRKSGTRLRLFFSTDDVIIVPGFMGSSLRDVQGPNGLIWIDPTLVSNGDQLNALKLSGFKKNQAELDAVAGVQVEARGAVPVIYDLLAADLELRRLPRRRSTHSTGARTSTDRRRSWPIGSGSDWGGSRAPPPDRPLAGDARRPARDPAARSEPGPPAGEQPGPARPGLLRHLLRRPRPRRQPRVARDRQQFRRQDPPGFEAVIQSFTGLYQLLPWNPAHVLERVQPRADEGQGLLEGGRGQGAARLRVRLGQARRHGVLQRPHGDHPRRQAHHRRRGVRGWQARGRRRPGARRRHGARLPGELPGVGPTASPRRSTWSCP